MANSGNARGIYSKAERGSLKGREQPGGRLQARETSGAARVAEVMARAEAGHARGSKTTESGDFMLGPNQAYHCTRDYAQLDKDSGQGKV